MRKHLVLAALAFCSLPAFAVRHIGFESDAFNRAYPVSYGFNMVFSPVSFEIDCALVAESLATIPKAGVSELMGVVIDFEGAYRPVVEELSVRTNGFSFVSARGFCVPEIKDTAVDHRIHLSRAYGAEVMSNRSPKGAESWFKATMDGEMENFALPPDIVGGSRYSFYDLVSCKVAWRDPFPTDNTRSIPFRLPDGSNVTQVVCMSDVRVADTWETREYTLLKLPLKSDAWFYAILPNAGYGLAPARADISSVEIDRLLAITKSVTEKGVAHGPCAIVLPRMDLRSRLDFTSILGYFRIPTTGLVHLAGPAAAREYVQYARFRLAEHAEDEPPLLKKPAEEVVPVTPDVKRLVFNHPFLFFVYHEKTESLLVVGQFMGRE